MKQIIKSIPTKTLVDFVNLDTSNRQNVYGVILAENQFGVIQQIDYLDESCRVYSIDRSFTCRNSFGIKSNNLKSCIESILKIDGRVYQFDNFVEFAKWVCENKS